MTEKMFSRRHLTSAALNESRIEKEAKVRRWLEIMEVNAEERAERTDKQQIALLNKRLGKNLGAKKERARLAKRMGV